MLHCKQRDSTGSNFPESIKGAGYMQTARQVAMPGRASEAVYLEDYSSR